MGKSSKTIVGSKEALTAEAVYNVAYRLGVVETDSFSLDLIAGKKVSSASILPRLDTPSFSGERKLLPDTQVRATLVVLLHKLLRGAPDIRTFLPIFIREVLNLGLTLDIPASIDDVGVISALVSCIYQIKESDEFRGNSSQLDDAVKKPAPEDECSGIAVLALSGGTSKLKTALEAAKAGEMGVTADEVAALKDCSAASIGLSALASYSLNSFTVVADAVAALSCEALQANTEYFESDSFKQAFVRKSETDVASDLNSLLFGSKLVKVRKGGLDALCIHSVPAAHGALRDAVKLLASRVRVEINRVETVSKKKPASSPNLVSTSGPLSPPSSLLTSTLLSLLVSLWPNISGSLERISKGLESIRELSLDSYVLTENWDVDSADEITSLKSSLQGGAATRAVFGDQNQVFLSQETLSAIETWRRMLSKECSVGLALLSIREGLATGRGGQDFGQGTLKQQAPGDNAGANGKAKNVTGGKGAKIKKDFVLGKGTDVVRKSLANYINESIGEDVKKVYTLSVMEKQLDSLLNPHVPGFVALLTELKGVLESNEIRRLPKIAKGTRDFKPEQMAIREKAFGIIAAIFKRHGAVALDTPVFELRETLMGKYGEDSKLIYDLADQGGEILSLRYDLTVPFARYLAMNKVENLKRYHIARVYRRDNPAKGRYREFYQCDLDIAGLYPPMVPDFEVLKVLTELLDELDIGDYEVKLNHRKLLDGVLAICGVPETKFRSICSAIDKLDKNPWEKIRKEMVEEKGLTLETADKIGGLVQKRGSPLVLLEELKQTGSPFLQHVGSSAALDELGVLFKYLKASKCIHRIVFDLSLARGLDYYTGVIYEAVFNGSSQPGSIAADDTIQVGSIAAGGRYDNLVGMFSGKQVPAVGVSLGIERVFAIMEKQEEVRKRVLRTNQTEVLVVVLGKDEKWTEIAIEIVTDLWEGRLKAEFACVARAKITQQIANAATSGIPWMVIAGEDELKAGIVQLKNISTKEQENIKRDNLVAELQRRVGASVELPTVVQ